MNSNPLAIPGGPAIWVGIIAAAIWAALLSLAGNGIIGPDVMTTIGRAIDPTQGGWALPILVGIVTRLFVSPAERIGWK